MVQEVAESEEDRPVRPVRRRSGKTERFRQLLWRAREHFAMLQFDNDNELDEKDLMLATDIRRELDRDEQQLYGGRRTR